MSAPIAGFIAALVLAALVILWITYCMFCRERHKSEDYHYDISDIRHKNYQLAQEQQANEAPMKKDGAKVGIFFLPSRHHKQKDDAYDKRPDYPESPAPAMQAGSDTLVEIFNDSVADVHYKDGIYEIDSASQFHSDV